MTASSSRSSSTTSSITSSRSDPAIERTSERAYVYTPTFTYHGFRYVELVATQLAVDGVTETALSPELAAQFPFGAALVAHRANTDLRRIASVTVPPHSMVAKVLNATLHSHVSNLWGIPTDCPQREKRGWMGDAGITALSLGTFYDSFAFHANFVRLIRDNQRKTCVDQPQTTINGPCTTTDPRGAAAFFNGSVPDVVPFATSPYGGNPGTVDWQAAYVLVAWAQLRHSGALAVPMLRDLWPSLTLFMGYLERLVDPATGLLLTNARGDWVPPSPRDASYPWRTNTPPVSAFFHTLSVSRMADIARAIGQDAEADRYTKRLAANRAAYHAKFFNNATETAAASSVTASAPPTVRCCYDTGSQTNNVMALYLGVVPEEHINATVGMLIAAIRDHNAVTPAPLDAPGTMDAATPLPPVDMPADVAGFPAWGSGAHFDGGIFGMTFVFETLRKYGQDALGLAMITETSYPSLGRMIASNATTLWEAWDGDAHTVGLQGSSRNHIMFGGGVARFIAATVGGVASAAATFGWEKIVVAPAPVALRSLGYGAMTRTTPRGNVSVSWRSRHAATHLDLRVPIGTTAAVALPLLVPGGVGIVASAANQNRADGGASSASCELRCAAGATNAKAELRGTAAACAIFADAECGVRLDGERIASFNVASGAYAFDVRATS